MLCWFFVLRLSYSTTVKNAHGFFIQMNIWNSARGWSLAWMQNDNWCLYCVDRMQGWTEGSIEDVLLASNCGNRNISIGKKHKRNKKSWNQRKESNANLSLYQSGVWYLSTRHAPLVKSVRSGVRRPTLHLLFRWRPWWGLAWACSAGWKEVSSAGGSNYSWGEEIHVDGEDPWLMMEEEGRTCSTRPEARRRLSRKSHSDTQRPWPLCALGRTQDWRVEQTATSVHFIVLTICRTKRQNLKLPFKM